MAFSDLLHEGVPLDQVHLAMLASCIGTTFDLAALAAVGPVQTHTVASGSEAAAGAPPVTPRGGWGLDGLCEDCLALERRGLVSANGAGTFEFVNEGTREGFYSLLPDESRTRVHAALVDREYKRLLHAKNGSREEALVFAALGLQVRASLKSSPVSMAFSDLLSS